MDKVTEMLHDAELVAQMIEAHWPEWCEEMGVDFYSDLDERFWQYVYEVEEARYHEWASREREQSIYSRC